jgi:uncharacterized protein YdaU (DUF1376 family)
LSAPPYIKLYVGDYHADTTHLSRSEHGAYLLLLMAMWRAGGSLPHDDARLARLSMCSPKEWAEMRATILAFFQARRGKIRHKRIDKELTHYETIVGKRKEAGKRGGRQKPKENNEETEANAKQNESNCTHNQNQNQTPIGELINSSPNRRGDGPLAPHECAAPRSPEERREVAALMSDLTRTLKIQKLRA